MQVAVVGGVGMRIVVRVGCIGLAMFLAAAAGTRSRLTVQAPWDEGAPIPASYTCTSGDHVPAISWMGAPPSAKSFALVVDDPDAPDPSAPQTDWVHWVLYDIPATASGVGPGDLPTGTREGQNDWKKTGYRGPCPPVGTHRYFARVYALDAVLPDLKQPTRAQLDEAMKGHLVAQGERIGRYAKP